MQELPHWKELDTTFGLVTIDDYAKDGGSEDV